MRIETTKSTEVDDERRARFLAGAGAAAAGAPNPIPKIHRTHRAQRNIYLRIIICEACGTRARRVVVVFFFFGLVFFLRRRLSRSSRVRFSTMRIRMYGERVYLYLCVYARERCEFMSVCRVLCASCALRSRCLAGVHARHPYNHLGISK